MSAPADNYNINKVMAKTKLNPKVQKALLKCVELGVPREQASQVVGISSATFRRWVVRGENPQGVEDDIYARLVNEIERSQAKFIKTNLEIIQKAAQRDAHHSEWLLERGFPALFGKRMEIDVGPSKIMLALQESAREALAKPDRKKPPEGRDDRGGPDLIPSYNSLHGGKDETDND